MHTVTRRTMLAGMSAGILAPPQSHAAPASRLVDARWRQFGTGGDPDHGAWTAVLGRHLSLGADGIARFDYANADLRAVEAYVARLESVDPGGLASAPAFAFWVNLYNAVTVRTVLRSFPVSSIRKIGGGVLSRGPWRQKLVRVADVPLSLDDIEHGILRPIWRDPRIHYAVNCAAIGCPNLAARAYSSNRLGAMLDEGARNYVNHPRGARFDNRGLQVSSIYTWFRSDFGGDDAGVIAHLRKYATAPLDGQLAGATRVSGHSYDWALNIA
ncbi:MAG: DUF547 domain-containing protein [Pseudomonadota bacterium]